MWLVVFLDDDGGGGAAAAGLQAGARPHTDRHTCAVDTRQTLSSDRMWHGLVVRSRPVCVWEIDRTHWVIRAPQTRTGDMTASIPMINATVVLAWLSAVNISSISRVKRLSHHTPCVLRIDISSYVANQRLWSCIPLQCVVSHVRRTSAEKVTIIKAARR